VDSVDFAIMATKVQQAPASQGVPADGKPLGYHKLAALMGKSRQMCIFRRFGKLTILNLLSLQAELVKLEDQLQHWREVDDRSSDPAEQKYSSYFYGLQMSEKKDNNKQWKALMATRKKLTEYRM
jgi:hypothetical protein